MDFKAIFNRLKNKALKSNNYWLYVIIIILMNVIFVSFSALNVRGDLTKNHSFTLSKVSKEVVSGISDPFIVKVFVSNDLQIPFSSVSLYIQDLLKEYKDNSNDNFKYEIVYVDSSDEKKSQAESYGIYPISVTERGDDQIKARSVYLGMVLIHGDLVEKIDKIMSPEGLEYSITTTIQKMISKADALVNQKKKMKFTLYASASMKPLNIQGYDGINSYVKNVFDKINKENYNSLSYEFVENIDEAMIDSLALKYGINPMKWDDYKDPTGASQIKAGRGIISVLVESGDKFRVVPFGVQSILGNNIIAGADSLEERAKGAINYIVSNNLAVGYVTGHGELNVNDQSEKGAGVFKQILSDMYQIEEINLKEKDIPFGIKTLIVNGPKEKLSDAELYKIDQFVMKGGSVIFFVNKFREEQVQQQMMMMGQGPIFLPVDSGLDKMLESYGLTVKPNFVLDKECYVSRQQGMGDFPIYYAPMPSVDSMNQDSVVTKYLKKLVVLKMSPVEVNETVMKQNGVMTQVLLKSSAKAWLTQGMINLSPGGMIPPEESKLSRQNLVVLAEGKFKSFFGGKKPEEATAEGKTTPVQDTGKIKTDEGLASGVEKSRIIVLGSSELTSANLLDPEGKSPNAIFVHNMIDYLNGNDNTPEMRSKGIEFNPIKDMTSFSRMVFKVINIFGLPLAVVLAGLIVWRVRLARKRKIEKLFSPEAR